MAPTLGLLVVRGVGRYPADALEPERRDDDQPRPDDGHEGDHDALARCGQVPRRRERAFAIAEERHDYGFFVDLFTHTPAMHDASDEGGSLGDIGGSFVESVRAARQVFRGDSVGDLEPLFRARFATYIREHTA